jgi:myo-inositol-1(or 4)-monophosphatase
MDGGEKRENLKRLTAAQKAARKAGNMLRSGKSYGITSKGKNDVVTEMDSASERLIIASLAKEFPEDGFFGEEGGMCGSAGSVPARSGQGLWIIDPIDGTDDFIHDIPNYTISIGYRNAAGDLTVGVIYNPRQGELFYAARGCGAFCNKKPIHVSPVSNPAEALSIAVPHLRLHDLAPYFFRLHENIFLRTWDDRNFGSAALHLAYVACGRVDAFYQLGLKLYDIAGGLVILSEAGGAYSGFFPEENVLETGNLLATNGALHPWYAEQIRSAGRP